MQTSINRQWLWIALGVALALAAVLALNATTQSATAAADDVNVTKQQLLINQRISQAGVKRSNEALQVLEPLRADSSNADKVRAWGTDQIADGAITSAKLDAALANLLPKWAVVNADGTLSRGTTGAASTKVNDGIYKVTFPTDVSACAWVATIGLPNAAVPPTGLVTTYLNPDEDKKSITVRTYPAVDEGAGALNASDPNENEDEADRPFHVAVTC